MSSFAKESGDKATSLRILSSIFFIYGLYTAGYQVDFMPDQASHDGQLPLMKLPSADKSHYQKPAYLRTSESLIAETANKTLSLRIMKHTVNSYFLKGHGVVIWTTLYSSKHEVELHDMAKLVVEFVKESKGKPRPVFQMGTIEYLDIGRKYDFTILIPYHESPEVMISEH
ncbi:uncharacterized protein MELLADRAFT_105214 [Melampsora larici-populina 98AG31]|uniref:Uncharacterized protein n=1 Tax=Melampsora larici-populina (strain 98AG31 / pathotype 3-4-7) TaxID=747676 RepID=F4RH24_MELLP|nr:uncharacterized protein MELLADRAFT_105214 [Melampsora larici-populina 98AG31]EGG08306.1 hypothetical protein MELLADRAFT_105214 [Melampsora larici-populina 98AG31]